MYYIHYRPLMYVCIQIYCSSQFSVLKLHIWAAVFAVQRTLIADGLGLRPINSVTSNGRIGYLNKCFLLDCFAKTVPNKELSFVINAKKKYMRTELEKVQIIILVFDPCEKEKKSFQVFRLGGLFMVMDQLVFKVPKVITYKKWEGSALFGYKNRYSHNRNSKTATWF